MRTRVGTSLWPLKNEQEADGRLVKKMEVVKGKGVLREGGSEGYE